MLACHFIYSRNVCDDLGLIGFWLLKQRSEANTGEPLNPSLMVMFHFEGPSAAQFHTLPNEFSVLRMEYSVLSERLPLGWIDTSVAQLISNAEYLFLTAR
jgi:hypothetical protein